MSDLYVETRGRGPDLVLLHGWGLNLRVWDGLTRELSKSFRVIAVDLPGHGRSPWNPKARTPAEQAWQVHAALASRSDRYSLLGWSMGGQIAIDLAAAMPGSVDRLVLVATTPRFAASEDWPYGMPAASLEKLATQLRTNYKRTVSEFLELQVRGSAASDKVLTELHSSLFSHGEAHPKALVAGLNTLRSSDLRSMLSLVRAPTLVIAGQYDRVTLPAASRALAEVLPDARYVEFRRAAHAPFLSHTAEFAALVTGFLHGDAEPATDAGAQTSYAEPARRGAVLDLGGEVLGGVAGGKAGVGGTVDADGGPGDVVAATALREAITAERILTGGEVVERSDGTEGSRGTRAIVDEANAGDSSLRSASAGGVAIDVGQTGSAAAGWPMATTGGSAPNMTLGDSAVASAVKTAAGAIPTLVEGAMSVAGGAAAVGGVVVSGPAADGAMADRAVGGVRVAGARRAASGGRKRSRASS